MFYFEQETSEQQEAEKDWIEQQRRKLDQVQKQINVILSVGEGEQCPP